jgi:hypothetical protein
MPRRRAQSAAIFPSLFFAARSTPAFPGMRKMTGLDRYGNCAQTRLDRRTSLLARFVDNGTFVDLRIAIRHTEG